MVAFPLDGVEIFHQGQGQAFLKEFGIGHLQSFFDVFNNTSRGSM